MAPPVEPTPHDDGDLKPPGLKSPPPPPAERKAPIDFEIVGVVETSTPGTASSSTLSASPVINNGGDFVSAGYAAKSPSSVLSNRANDLSLSMRAEGMNLIVVVAVAAASSARTTSYSDPIDLLSSDEESEGFDLKSPAFSSVRTGGSRLTNRNQIFVYRFATPYIITAHLGRNGPHNDEKVYDREFMTALFDSIHRRDQDHDGFNNQSLLCNQLKIHSVKMMHKEGSANKPKTTEYANGGLGYHNVLVRVLTRHEIINHEGSDENVIKWMDSIRSEYLKVKTQYQLHLELGGILGRSGSTKRSLDHMLLDSDVADYAKLIYHKQYLNGTLIDDPKKVSKFFAVSNAKAAGYLLG